MNGLQDLPASLAAVEVRVAGPHPGGVQLRDLVELFTQIAPIFHGLQSLEVALPAPGDTTYLLVFYDRQAAQQAVELFDGYPLDAASHLEVHPAPRQPLQRLAQVLVKCMQAAAFSSTEPSRSTPPLAPGPEAQPLGPQPPGWPQMAAAAQQQQRQGTPPPQSFPPSQLSTSTLGQPPRHGDLAAAAAAAWGAPGTAAEGYAQQSGYQRGQQQQQQQYGLGAGYEASAAPAAAGPSGSPWDAPHPRGHIGEHGSGGSAGRFPPSASNGNLAPGSPLRPPPGAGAAPAAAGGWAQQALVGEAPWPQPAAPQHQHQQQQQQQMGGYPPAGAVGDPAFVSEAFPGRGPAAPPAPAAADGDAEMVRLQLGAMALRKQQEEFLAQHRAAAAAAAQDSLATGGEPPPPPLAAPPAQPPGRQQGWAAVAAAAPALGQEEASGSGAPVDGLTCKLFVKNILPKVKPETVRAVFARYGPLHEVAKAPDAPFCFLTFHSTEAAAAAFAELNEEPVPTLSGGTPLWIEFREAGPLPPPPAGGSGSGDGTPTSGGGKMGGAKFGPHATYEGSMSRDPSRNPLKRHEEEADHPTTKLWVGGVSGDATEEVLKRLFGKYGPVFGIELRPAPEPGRRDQWAFVNFRKVADAVKARNEMVDRVIPELTGSMRLKLRFKEPHGKEAQLSMGGARKPR